MLKNICTIVAPDGHTRQGSIDWINDREFWFTEGCKIFWGDTNYWTIVGHGVKIFNLKVEI